MTPSPKTILAAGLLALAALAPELHARGKAAPPPDLSGTWTLNEDVTYRLMEESRRQSPGPGGDRMPGPPSGGGRRGGGMGRPGGGPGGGPGGPGGFRSPDGAPPRPPFEGLDTVTVTQTATEVTLTGSDGRTRTWKTDGSKRRDESTPGGPAEVTASWSGEGSLVVTVKPGKGPKRTEVWTVSNDRKRLYLTLHMEGGRRPPLRRAYDAAPPATDRPTAPRTTPEGDGA